jgi:hypothetical protein
MFLTTAGQADQLQFQVSDGSGTSFAAFATVHVFNSQNVEQFVGDADRFGRIVVNIAPGTYRAVMIVRGTTKSTELRLSGEQGLRVITLN